MPDKHDAPPGSEVAPPASGAASAREIRLTRAEAVAMTLVGLDVGARHLGMAIKPAGQDWALPSRVLEVRDEAQAIAALQSALMSQQPDGIVVGLPVHPDGAQARAIRKFCRQARAGMRGARWFFVDERLTSQQAESLTINPKGRRADDLAAALILETFLQTCR